MSKWKKTAAGNEILDGDEFYISFNENKYNSVVLAPFYTALTTLTGDDRFMKISEETALCVDGKYYILRGDFRKEYEELVPKGLDACIKFYKKNKKKYQSIWSTDMKIKENKK